MSSLRLPLLLSAALLATSPASAALFVSGDTNILTEVEENDANAQFLLNLAGDGIVVLHPGQFANFVTPGLSFVLGDADVPHVLLGWDAEVTAASLVGASLYLAYQNGSGWSAAEAALLADFVRGGGHVLLTGDNFVSADENAAITALAAAMGSDLSIQDTAVGPFPGVGATILEDNGFTAGTAGLQLISASRVLGGRPLYGIPGSADVVVAYDTLSGAVPEPASWALLIAGFGIVGSALRRQRRGLPVLS